MNKAELKQALEAVQNSLQTAINQISTHDQVTVDMDSAHDIFELGYKLGAASSTFSTTTVEKEVELDEVEVGNYGGLSVTISGNVQASVEIDEDDVEWERATMDADDKQSAEALIKDWANKNFVTLTNIPVPTADLDTTPDLETTNEAA